MKLRKTKDSSIRDVGAFVKNHRCEGQIAIGVGNDAKAVIS